MTKEDKCPAADVDAGMLHWGSMGWGPWMITGVGMITCVPHGSPKPDSLSTEELKEKA
jgi:hypothetical protein